MTSLRTGLQNLVLQPCMRMTSSALSWASLHKGRRMFRRGAITLMMLDESFGLFWRAVSAIWVFAAIWICNTLNSFFVSPRIPLVWCSGCCYKFIRNTRQRHFCPIRAGQNARSTEGRKTHNNDTSGSLGQAKVSRGIAFCTQMQHRTPQNTQQRHNNDKDLSLTMV